MKKITVTAFVIIFVLIAVGAPFAPAAAQTAAKLTVSAQTARLFIGETLQLNVTCSDPDVPLEGLTFTSSNPKCAKVSSTGLVTALKKGSVKITARTADKKLSAAYTVQVEVKPESIRLTVKQNTLIAGKKMKAAASVLPRETNDRSVVWETDRKDIAAVSAKGEISGLAPGKAVITVRSVRFPEVSASAEITVVRLAGKLTLSAETPSVLVGETIPLTLQIEPADVSSREVAYKSAQPKIAAVDADGIVTGVKAGKTEITVTAKDGSKKTAKILVTVIQPVTGVFFQKDEITLGVGVKKTIAAVVEPKNATNKAMIWDTDHPEIVTVSGASNKVTLKVLAWGDAVVTGTTVDGEFTATLYVRGGLEREAVKMIRAYLNKRGQLQMVLRNESDIEIGGVRVAIRGFDLNGDPVVMSDSNARLPDIEPCDIPKGGFIKDPLILNAVIFDDWHPGAQIDTRYDTLIRPIHNPFANAATLQVAVTGYTCLDASKYDINPKYWKWVNVK